MNCGHALLILTHRSLGQQAAGRQASKVLLCPWGVMMQLFLSLSRLAVHYFSEAHLSHCGCGMTMMLLLRYIFLVSFSVPIFESLRH